MKVYFIDILLFLYFFSKMGCCSSREGDSRGEATLFPSKGQSTTKAPNAFFLQVNPNRSAEFYETQNWEQLSLLCYSDHPVQRKVKFRWASPPSTVGSFSMQLLARQASKDATPLLKLLPGLFPDTCRLVSLMVPV